jgi:nucleoid-associated protein YgaU
MARILHGDPLPVPAAVEVVNVLLPRIADAQPELAAELGPILRAVAGNLQAFDFLFPDLQGNPANLLPAPPEAMDTPTKLADLGRAMIDPNVLGPTEDSGIPAVYTYLGQFIDHDITFESGTPKASDMVNKPDLVPLDLATIKNNVKNARTGTLDLDSVYTLDFSDPEVVNGDRLGIGTVTIVSANLPNCAKPFCRPARSVSDEKNDLPRKPRNTSDPPTDREAKIGDPRNDENLIISQLHLSFLRAHNAIVDMGHDFAGARRTLRQHYQHIVLHDFLTRIANAAIVDDILQNGNTIYDPDDANFFLPLEFSFAAYRFGHTMIRDDYNFNLNFNRIDGGGPGSLALLFTFTALSGELGGSDTLPDNWIIEWERIIDLGAGSEPDLARRLDTNLAKPGVFALQNIVGTVLPGDEAILALRNLLRGYLLRLPTGQAVATKLGLTPMTAAEIEAAAASPAQVAALQAGGFSQRTPLWYYILAEAAHFEDGKKLGPVGSTLVAEVLIGLARRSEDSILTDPVWAGPTLPSAVPGTFTLTDLLRFAGVLGGAAVACQYTVVTGDTLSIIAQRLYGDPSQWPRIFNANQDQISDPDVIFPGQVLRIPATGQHTVVAGDSLSGIAQQFYADASLWPRIFNVNQDQISDPTLIFPGQVLCIP